MLADRTAASAGLPPPRACKQRSWDLQLGDLGDLWIHPGVSDEQREELLGEVFEQVQIDELGIRTVRPTETCLPLLAVGEVGGRGGGGGESPFSRSRPYLRKAPPLGGPSSCAESLIIYFPSSGSTAASSGGLVFATEVAGPMSGYVVTSESATSRRAVSGTYVLSAA